MSESILSVHHLGKTVQDSSGELEILRDISFEIPQGKTCAIVGASGSGKSTLLTLLAGLDTPSRGQVQLAGVDLFSLDEDQRAQLRARHVGFVFQNFQLLPHYTALENVMMPLELAGQRDARERARQMLGHVGLGQRLSHLPRLLSGGEQQRVALARAFVTRPQLLLADEPTGSLDHATGKAVADLMFKLNQESGTTLVLVTHDMGLAQRCDSVLTLQAGALISRS
jgi:putative ABC transport system ATP-binding protein